MGLQPVAREAECVQEVPEALVDGGPGQLREVEAQALEDLGIGAGPQGEQGQGDRDTQWGEEDVRPRPFGGHQVVEAEGKASVARQF